MILGRSGDFPGGVAQVESKLGEFVCALEIVLIEFQISLSIMCEESKEVIGH